LRETPLRQVGLMSSSQACRAREHLTRATVLLLFLVAGFGPCLSAQTDRGGANSSAEKRRLRYFVGVWHNEATYKTSALGPAGTFVSTERGEMLGDSFLVVNAHGHGLAEGGDLRELVITATIRPRSDTSRRVTTIATTRAIELTATSSETLGRGDPRLTCRTERWTLGSF
jgi:hypothetical protein